ncbi:hypothetical protein CEP52_002557 [Fusarium oligoseptatum]|uniref:Xylanolytic transcriptional activator regulatory domain-containing protein n=1 Tax=Fusarium oligoseptatum TaxID=2604345 RepID=A0A428UDJ2_9HYPO|nr:hypothetical protein CEP52_002557 [Fusarium oligoseptatum]
MTKVAVLTDKAPKPRPIYNQAIIANGFVFCSGQLPKDLNGNIVQGTVQDRTRQCIKNLQAVLEAAGSSLEDVVEVNVFLSDMSDFSSMNQVYGEYWGEVKPSRTYLNELRSGIRNQTVESPSQEDTTIIASNGHEAVQESHRPSTLSTDVSPVNPPCRDPQTQSLAPSSSQLSAERVVGESTCVAFSNRILQCLNPQPTPSSMSTDYPFVHSPSFARQMKSATACKLPDRIRANLLVRLALHFIGHDYHFFLQRDFLQQMDKVYGAKDAVAEYDSVWACKFFVVLALGDLYSSANVSTTKTPCEVPGTDYFVTANELLQDHFEEPSLAQVETMLLFCFYSNALGRTKSAHMYSGIALRLSTSLKLHRNLSEGSDLSAVDREHRIRLWWTVYIFDRSTSSRLSLPATIQDRDIDVDPPTSDGLASDVQDVLGPPAHLIAHLNLARITGCIMQDIYGLSSKENAANFVQNVRAILQRLTKWDAHVPSSLRWSQSANRSVASLHLHFNQCIILTTRPVLLHVLKEKQASGTLPPLPDTTKTLADSCVSAARTSNAIFLHLFIGNSLAVRGYFDAHHLFSSTLVLIISAIISPNSNDADAVQTAFQLMVLMKESGNLAALQYLPKMLQIQKTVTRMFAGDDGLGGPEQEDHPPTPMHSGFAECDAHEWNNMVFPESLVGPGPSFDEAGPGHFAVDPLDNPLLQAFLDHTESNSRDENLGVDVEGMGFIL